jgi:hypothetical protein
VQLSIANIKNNAFLLALGNTAKLTKQLVHKIYVVKYGIMSLVLFVEVIYCELASVLIIGK